MGKKLFINTLYTIGMILSGIVGYQYGIVQKEYGYIVAAVLIIAIFIVLKIRLLKEIKRAQKP